MRGKTLFGAALAALTAVVGAGSVAQADPVTKWKGAPETSEEDRAFRVNGRVMYDLYNVDAPASLAGSNQNYTRSATRRAFLGVEGRFTQNWRYNVKFDLNPDGTGGRAVQADDFYIEYAGSNYSVFIGQNNAISPMEDRDSSLTIPFNERSGLISAFGWGKQMGVAYLTNGGNWSLGAGVYGDQLQKQQDNVAQGESVEERARFTWAPIYERTPSGVKLLHLGVTARHRDNGQDALYGYSVIPNVNYIPTKFVDTGGFASSDNTFQGEFAFQYNQFGIDGEYGVLKAKRSASAGFGASTGDPQFSGGYVGVYWSPTGESRVYNAADGSFKNVVPLRTLGSPGGIGHVMLAARYDFIDLTDEHIDGGEQKAWVLGATWVPIDHVKFQLNYSNNDTNLNGSGTIKSTIRDVKGDVNAVVLRSQLDW